MRISVVLPALDEAARIADALRSARAPAVCELIVVDGGSTDATTAIAAGAGARVCAARRGRAAQMNTGAAQACGDVLLFLHADTCLPRDFDTAIRAALSDTSVVGGRFDVRLESSTPLLALVAGLMNVRSRWSGIATGDQAIFVRRAVFETMGGFEDIPIMEDVAFSRALKRRGRVACLRAKVTTSSRRWQVDGPVRTIALMWWLRFLYWGGVPPAALKQRYADTR